MNAIPTAIEAYFREAGFTATEMLIIRKLMEGEGLTLRQLAAKTGKSTGVLDQAMKKLLRKEIVTRQIINDTPCYVMISLRALQLWMTRDMKEKRDMMMRKYQNFEMFLQTLEAEKKRPDMEFFDGLEGLEQAYAKVLQYGPEILQYVPVICSAEDDPLRECKVDWFRSRRSRQVFARVIAHDTPLGRRYRSRDPFEYRQSLLVPESQYPFSFEKIIAGDTITCINPIEKRACFIRYPEMAAMERGLFEGIWKGETAKDSKKLASVVEGKSEKIEEETEGRCNEMLPADAVVIGTAVLADDTSCHSTESACEAIPPELVQPMVAQEFAAKVVEGKEHTVSAIIAILEARLAQADAVPLPPSSAQPQVPLRTRFLSAAREFFLSPRSLASLILLGVCAALLSGGMYWYASALNFQRLRERVMSIAATGALQIDADDLAQLNVEADWRKPEWSKVVRQLERVRLQNQNVQYVYIFRRDPNDAQRLQFVADSHSLNPYANSDADPTNDVDVNGPLRPDTPGSMVLQWPGMAYEAPAPEAFSGFGGNASTADFYEDQWGRVLTGYSPIYGKDGTVVAVYAVDFADVFFNRINYEVLVPIATFLGCLVLFLALRFFAQNRGLLAELWYGLNYRRTALVALAIAEVAAVIILAMYVWARHERQQQIGERLMSIATVAATQFDVADLDQLNWAKDMKTEAYQRVYRQLNDIRSSNPEIKWVYILKKVPGEQLFRWVADGDSNYFTPYYTETNFDGEISSADQNVFPGMFYMDLDGYLEKGLQNPTYTVSFSDQWGPTISGSSAIDANYVLAIDVDSK